MEGQGELGAEVCGAPLGSTPLWTWHYEGVNYSVLQEDDGASWCQGLMSENLD